MKYTGNLDERSGLPSSLRQAEIPQEDALDGVQIRLVSAGFKHLAADLFDSRLFGASFAGQVADNTNGPAAQRPTRSIIHAAVGQDLEVHWHLMGVLLPEGYHLDFCSPCDLQILIVVSVRGQATPLQKPVATRGSAYGGTLCLKVLVASSFAFAVVCIFLFTA